VDLLGNGALQSADSNYTYTSDTEAVLILDQAAIDRAIMKMRLNFLSSAAAFRVIRRCLEVLPTQDAPWPSVEIPRSRVNPSQSPISLVSPR